VATKPNPPAQASKLQPQLENSLRTIASRQDASSIPDLAWKRNAGPFTSMSRRTTVV